MSVVSRCVLVLVDLPDLRYLCSLSLLHLLSPYPLTISFFHPRLNGAVPSGALRRAIDISCYCALVRAPLLSRRASTCR